MAPSAAVEIDPRLLRQLEEEYETLKNDSSGARGLGSNGASARLLSPSSTMTEGSRRRSGPRRSPRPPPRGPPTDFSKWIKRRLRQAKSAGLARVAKPTAARADPVRARGEPARLRAPRRAGCWRPRPPDDGRIPARARPARATSDANPRARATRAVARTRAVLARSGPHPTRRSPTRPRTPKPMFRAPGLLPVVFQPRGVPSPDKDDRADDARRARSCARNGFQSLHDGFRALDYSAGDSVRGRLARRRRRTRIPRPGAEMADRMARTVVGVGERARRMAEATALAQHDMARRLAETGAPRVGRGDGTVSRGYDPCLSRSGGARRSRREDSRGGRASATRTRVGDEE